MAKGKATILLYHQIGDHPIEQTNLDCFCTIEQFEEQMSFLHESEIEVISLHSLINILKNNQKFEENYVVLTFDDGCERFQTIALPIIQKYQFPSIVYPVSGNLGRLASWPKITNHDLRLLSEENLKNIAKCGVDIGGHTVNHVKLGEVSMQEAEIEIKRCKWDLERIIDQGVYSFSYPHGSFNEAIARLVSSVGFACAVTCKPSFIYGDEDLYQLPRKYVTYSDGLDSFRKILGYE
ncbi:MAG: polysaccharide deacetylase family protein [Flectobacillus sp.]|nr:polysaccharide deacetylase family protein [Flectobacillus sp.]